MESYKVRVKKSVTKDLRSIPNKDVVKILARIETCNPPIINPS